MEETELKMREPEASDRYAVKWGGYNARRYSRPWIAKITAWPIGDTPTLEFGGYCGDGSGGETEITADVGDILRSGRKDNHRGKKTINEWYLAQANGNMELIDAVKARKLYKA